MENKNKIENKDQLRNELNKSYDITTWQRIIEYAIPSSQFFKPKSFLNDQKISSDERAILKEFNQIGFCDVFDHKGIGKKIGLFEVKLRNKGEVYNQKEIVRNLIGKFINPSGTPGIIAVIDSDNKNYRFSFAAKKITMGDDGEDHLIETDTKKYTYIVGQEESCHTPAQRLEELRKHNAKLNIDNIIDAFKVDSLSNEFFSRYTEIYKDFVQEIWGYRIEKKAGKWQPIKKGKASPQFKDIFNNDPKAVRDYIKILLGRLVFIKFLEKKGWLGALSNDSNWITGDKNFLYNQFKTFKNKEKFHSNFLIPLFYNGFNLEDRPNNIFELTKSKIPYLNGGLFRDFNSKLKQLNFSQVRFIELFSFFEEYNFTIDENNKDDQEVGIDPEMLGRIFENLLEDNKEKGAFHTPKSIVEYMCQESLIEYLYTYIESIGQLPETLDEQIKLKDDIGSFIRSNHANNVYKYRYIICDALYKVKICDPAIGSGAFPIGILKEIFDAVKYLFDNNRDYVGRIWGFEEKDGKYQWDASKVKLNIIQNSIYGVDIEQGAVDIARLRFWLSLIVEEKTPTPLPSLNYKVVVGNSLDGFPFISPSTFEDLKIVKENKDKIFDPNNHEDKSELIKNTEKIFEKLYSKDSKSIGRTVGFDLKMHFSEIFDGTFGKSGFDIVIANPPYVNTKEIKGDNRKLLETNFGWVDDLYNHFTIKAFDYAGKNGVITFITSDTFLTLQTKLNMRTKLLEHELLKIIPTPKAFAAMVDTAIFIVKKTKMESNYKFDYIDLRKPDFNKLNIPEGLLLKNDLSSWERILVPLFNALKYKKEYAVSISSDIYRDNLNKVIFSPTSTNLQIRFKIIPQIKPIYDQWWDSIQTSAKITKNKRKINNYISSLIPGNITLMGVLTDGGQGLATANNGKFVGCLRGTKVANNILTSRPKKLFNVFNQNLELYKRYPIFKNCNSAKEFTKAISNLSENQIRQIFDDIKEDYGRDIFSQGYLYRIISKEEIVNANQLTKEEKELGVANNRKDCFVSYDKGDKDGNRWYLETPYYLIWNKKTVNWFKSNSGKKGEGMPVLRNPQFYFKEGFCWSDVQTTYLKCRYKNKSVHDVKSMSMFTADEENFPNYYFISLINSKFISEYQQEFLNNTASFQINDARSLPVLKLKPFQLNSFKKIFDEAIEVKKKEFSGKLNKEAAINNLKKIQKKLDELVYNIFDINPNNDFDWNISSLKIKNIQATLFDK